MRLLDLFCGAGGASRGYVDAGFEVVGVDLYPQPNYPYEFWLGDALYILEHQKAMGFDAIHASPPCQVHSSLGFMHPHITHIDLIPETRELLEWLGKPYVIENVEGSGLHAKPKDPDALGITLCGSMFGLEIEKGFLRRHRHFETNFYLDQPICQHQGRAVGVYGHSGHRGKHRMLHARDAASALRIDWMTRDEMSQAIPPVYTEFIANQLRYHLIDVKTL